MYFDESAVSVVDSWLKSAAPETDAPKKKQFSKKSQPPPAAVATEPTDGRKGLGYIAPKVKSKSKAEQAVDAVVSNIQKKKKYTAVLSDQYEPHGVVEEEISRIKEPKKSISAAEDVGLNIDEKARPKNGFSKNAGERPPAQLNKSTPQSKPQPNNPNPKKRLLEDSSINPTGTEGHEPRARKRTKTRSRQKNIRRDKRSDAFKPEHLRLGSSEYAGYQLTEETKGKLGIF